MTRTSPQSDATCADASGRMAGEYLLMRKLGEGGCGAVYEAAHPLLGRRAAVKVLHRAPLVGSTGLSRFIAEAKTVNHIRSRHIVDVFSFGELDDGRPFYVMDLLEGEPLDRYLARLGRLSVAAALRIARPIADALDVAHAASIVHRDLKPQNIFLALDPSGEVVPKLLDFGVAKLLHDGHALTLSGAVIGTPSYMSPEQARGESVDARSDVYALGVLCYELLTGKLPLRGTTVLGVAMAHITEAPEPPSTMSDLPPALDAPILHMLAKRPRERPASAGAAIAAWAQVAERLGLAAAADGDVLPRPLPPPASPRSLPETVEATRAGSALARSAARPRLLLPAASAPPRRARRIGFTSAACAAVALALLLFARSSSPAMSAPERGPTAAATSAFDDALRSALEPSPRGALGDRPAHADLPHALFDARDAAIAPTRTSAIAPRPRAPSAHEPGSTELVHRRPAPAGNDATRANTPASTPSPAVHDATRALVPTRARPARARPRVRAMRESIPSDLENPF